MKQYVVDAFTDTVFKGNPAAVCVLEKEDPVCGSGHCHIIPIWTKKQKKESFIARQN